MSISDPLVVGTRGSELALRQASIVRSKLEAAGRRVELTAISTRGDEATDTPISEIGDEAVFTKEIDRALLSGDVDLAVHSLKDIPSTVPEGIVLAAIGEREEPFDAFVAHPSFDGHLEDLPEGATVATASLRRTAQLLTWRSDLDIVPVRGNVDTRLEKLRQSDWTGMVLAVAGLARLGLSVHIRDRIDPEIMIPAVGQGALGIACLEENDTLRSLLRDALHHAPTGHAAVAERTFLREVGGGVKCPSAPGLEWRTGCSSSMPVLLHSTGESAIGGSERVTRRRGGRWGRPLRRICWRREEPRSSMKSWASEPASRQDRHFGPEGCHWIGSEA